MVIGTQHFSSHFNLTASFCRKILSMDASASMHISCRSRASTHTHTHAISVLSAQFSCTRHQSNTQNSQLPAGASQPHAVIIRFSGINKYTLHSLYRTAHSGLPPNVSMATHSLVSRFGGQMGSWTRQVSSASRGVYGIQASSCVACEKITA